MGHIINLNFNNNNFEKLENIIKKAPYYYNYDVQYKIFEFRDSERNDLDITPDCIVKITENGLEFNAIGNYELCRKINDYLEKEIEREFKKIIRIL